RSTSCLVSWMGSMDIWIRITDGSGAASQQVSESAGQRVSKSASQQVSASLTYTGLVSDVALFRSQVKSVDDLRGPAGRLEAVLNTGREDALYAAGVGHPHPP